MALSVNTNVGALNALASAASNNKSLETSMARLASGKRINSASDDAAGVAIASRLTAEVKGTEMSIRNASDAQSLVNTAEGAAVEITNILQRMRELAVQSGNDTNSANDRTNLQAEMTSLTAEIDRIANVTSWAGKPLLDGPAASANAAQTTQTGNANFVFQIGSGTTVADQLTVDIGAMGGTALGISGTAVPATAFTLVAGQTGTVAAITSVGTGPDTLTFSTFNAVSSTSVNINGTVVSITNSATDNYAESETGYAAQMKDAIEAANISGITVTQVAGVLTIGQGGSLSIASASAAQTAIGTIDSALQTVNNTRANLGSVSNRLDHTIANLTNTSVNLQAGLGRIEDADFAAESTNMAKANILAQASTAMLAQANASKQGVLQLLQR